MNNLVIVNYPGPDAFIGEIVRTGRTITVLSQYGKYVNFLEWDDVQSITEEIYDDLNDYGKEVVDNWDHDEMTELAEENRSFILG